MNKLRSLIRGLNQIDIKYIYYRGLTLSNTEIQYYIDRKNEYYYTNSFTSFTIDRLLVYSGNTLLILKTENSSENAKKNLANIWKWSTFNVGYLRSGFEYFVNGFAVQCFPTQIHYFPSRV